MSAAEAPLDDHAARVLAELGSISLREHTTQSLLQAVADMCKSVMPGDTEASIFIQDDRRKFTVVSTGQLALDLDEVQYSDHHGPCLHAASTGELTEIADTRTDTRWPDYAASAAGHGNFSSLSVPLVIDAGVSGALNIYARQVRAFDERARSTALRFGPYAATAVGNMRDYEGAQSMAANLQVALESRAVIDQAKGILMERHKMTADQAFQALTQVSSRTNTKLRTIAEYLVSTGELPTSGPR